MTKNDRELRAEFCKDINATTSLLGLAQIMAIGLMSCCYGLTEQDGEDVELASVLINRVLLDIQNYK